MSGAPMWNGTITAKVIPKNQHRYPTAGDWWFDPDGTLQIRVSECGDPQTHWCLMIHELQEAMLCHFQGVTTEAVDRFDIAFEEGKVLEDEREPGDEPSAPYHRQHGFATAVERMTVAALGMNWAEYEQRIP